MNHNFINTLKLTIRIAMSNTKNDILNYNIHLLQLYPNLRK